MYTTVSSVVRRDLLVEVQGCQRLAGCDCRDIVLFEDGDCGVVAGGLDCESEEVAAWNGAMSRKGDANV